MGVLTGTGVMPPPVQAAFDRQLLRRAMPKLHHTRPALKKSIKAKSGNTMIFRRIGKLPLAKTPLMEGVPPTGRQLSKTDVQCTLQQHGDFVVVTDLAEATVQHPVLREATKVLGEQAGETFDSLDADVWAAGTSVFYGGGVAGRANLTGILQKVTAALLERIIRYLGQQNATMFTEMVNSSSDEGTIQIRDAYWGITSPEVYFTLDSLAGFVAVEHYAGQTKVMRGEVGAYKNIRFLVTTQAVKYAGGGGSLNGTDDVKVTGGLTDVHTILVFAEDAVAEVGLDGGNLQNIIKPIGEGGGGDPLDQVGTTGWKMSDTRVRLNEAWLTRAEVTVADVSP